MKVKVCDAICGKGKTQSCITMMNNNKNERYIFITPYLSEVERIKEKCSSREFVSPEQTYEFGFSKLEALHKLLKDKKNIASTHALFGLYNDDTRELIEKGGYTLVLDEVLNIFQQVDMSVDDINILTNSNTIVNDSDKFVWNSDEYETGAFNDIKVKAKSNNLLKYRDEMYFWSIPPDIFKAFKQIYILTYMFQYQTQKYFFDIYGIEYELIGTKKENGIYSFCSAEEMDRKMDLRDKIHILDSEKLNKIGEENGSLSFSWYRRAANEDNQKSINTLRNNLHNLFVNIYKGESNLKMWSTFKDYSGILRGKGYSKGFIAYNRRATNEFANKRYLAYCINVYMQTWAKNYLLDKGAKDVNENMYAMSTLIQWVFRSAIRKGEEIWLYLPSLRMRKVFIKWLDNLAEGKDLEPINFDKTIKRNESSFKNNLMGLKDKLQLKREIKK